MLSLKWMKEDWSARESHLKGYGGAEVTRVVSRKSHATYSKSLLAMKNTLACNQL